MAHCKYCGNSEDLLEEWGYDWDAAERGDEMALSIQIITGRYCAYATDCAERVVAQGTNLDGLRMVAADHDNFGELATKARDILHRWSKMTQDQAHTADLVARENGWGVTGGPA